MTSPGQIKFVDDKTLSSDLQAQVLCSVALHLVQSLTEGRITLRAVLDADTVGQTNFSAAVPGTHESKKQPKKNTSSTLSNFRNGPSQISRIICLKCSLVPSETRLLTPA